MSSPITKTKKTSSIKPRQKLGGRIGIIEDIVFLPGGQRIMTCSLGWLRVWDLKSGQQIEQDWRDGGRAEASIALSPDGKKMVSGGYDGVVRLWDIIDTCKVITKWTGHTDTVWSVCWRGDGQRVLSESWDGTARQWDVESGETILEPIFQPSRTGSGCVVVYSPDMTLIATAGSDRFWDKDEISNRSLIKIWDAKTGKHIATLKGHRWHVNCLAWTKDGKTLMSGSDDHSIRTWDTTNWEQTAILVDHTSYASPICAIAISPNERILASVSYYDIRLWNLDNGKPISSPLQHGGTVVCRISFSEDGKLLATSCHDVDVGPDESGYVYIWDVVSIPSEAGLEHLPSGPKANKLAFSLDSDATRRPIQRRPPAYRTPQGFFDGVPPGGSRFSTQKGLHSSSEPEGSTFIHRLFHRSPSNTRDSSQSSSIKWAQALLNRRSQSSEGTELRGPVEVPYAKGKRRNASAREVAVAKQKQKMKALHSKNSTASSSRPPKPNVMQQSGTIIQTQPSLQPQPAVGNNAAASSSRPSRPDVVLRQAGLWTRFWLFLGCLSPEYQDGRH